MTSRDFCFWLQGYIEIGGLNKDEVLHLNPDQLNTVKKHLALVFVHEIDPSFPPEQQDKLNLTHGQPSEGILYRC